MIDEKKLRAWWSHRQGLDGRLAGASAAEVLAQTGWARSVGGVGPYLTLFSRAGLSREAVDAAVARLELHELPSARGCTYVLPAEDFALGLAVGQAFGGDELRVAQKLGVTEKEIDTLCAAIVKTLGKGPLGPDELREATGSASRSLGEAGKKKGLTTTMPIALGKLQAEGELRRIPTNGRLDQQRYQYALWRPSPLANFKRSREECEVELARRYFRWIGPATLADFQAFSGLGVKASKAATAPLGLVPIDDGDERVLLPEHAEAFRAFQVPKTPRYTLVSSLDGLALLRRDLGSLVDEKDLDAIPREKGRAGGSLQDLPSHGIFDRGRLVGLWEYDVETQSLAWTSFVKKDAALKEAVARTEAYVRDQLGDARSFSLDSPKSRAPRIAALRAAG